MSWHVELFDLQGFSIWMFNMPCLNPNLLLKNHIEFCDCLSQIDKTLAGWMCSTCETISYWYLNDIILTQHHYSFALQVNVYIVSQIECIGPASKSQIFLCTRFLYSQQDLLFCCYALNQGGEDHKCALGLITWPGSDEWTRTRRICAMRISASTYKGYASCVNMFSNFRVTGYIIRNTCLAECATRM